MWRPASRGTGDGGLGPGAGGSVPAVELTAGAWRLFVGSSGKTARRRSFGVTGAEGDGGGCGSGSGEHQDGAGAASGGAPVA